MVEKYGSRNIALSLPSLRMVVDSVKLIDSLPTRRKSGLTFALEAGSQRLQKVINKCIPSRKCWIPFPPLSKGAEKPQALFHARFTHRNR